MSGESIGMKKKKIFAVCQFPFFRCNIEIYRLAQLFFVGQWARVVNNCTHQLEKKSLYDVKWIW